MKYAIVYGREIGPMKKYMEVYIKTKNVPEIFDTKEEAEARIVELTTSNPIAKKNAYKVKELEDAEAEKLLNK